MVVEPVGGHCRGLRPEEQTTDPSQRLRKRHDRERGQPEVGEQLAERLRDRVEPLVRGVGKVVAVPAQVVFLGRARRERRCDGFGSDCRLCRVGAINVVAARGPSRDDSTLLLETRVKLRGARQVKYDSRSDL